MMSYYNSTQNPTCLITGRTDNLKMYPLRDKKGNMIGWIFLHETENPEDISINYIKVFGEEGSKPKGTTPLLMSIDKQQQG